MGFMISVVSITLEVQFIKMRQPPRVFHQVKLNKLANFDELDFIPNILSPSKLENFPYLQLLF